MSRIQKAIARASQLRQEQEREPAKKTVSPVEAGAREPVPQSEDGQFPEVEERNFQNALMVTQREQKGIFSEQFRKLKSEVLTRTANGQLGNTLLVTSSIAGEGKTFSACNLAVTLAREYDHTVLLVDADLRRPRTHELFNLPPGPGLVQCLHGEVQIEDVLQHVGIGKLSLLQAGGTVEDPVELLSSSKMKTLLNEIKHRYQDRFVVIDCSPALLFADTSVLAPVVDGVIYVVRERIARLKQIQQGLSLLKEANILGVVYNGAEEQGTPGDYVSYY